MKNLLLKIRNLCFADGMIRICLLYTSYYGIVSLGDQSYTIAVIPGILILVMTVYVFTFPKYQTEPITSTFFGVLYAPVMLSCI